MGQGDTSHKERRGGYCCGIYRVKTEGKRDRKRIILVNTILSEHPEM